MGIKVYNTLTRKKEDFVPLKSDKVTMYVCGPTTYNYIHLGNARPIVVFDTIRKYFEYKGFKVTYVQNYTDVDDKIINKAKEEGVDPLKLAERYIREYEKDAEALNVRPADVHPKVSTHIPEIINLIKTLVEKGHAYEIDGDVYFEVDSFEDYGKLSCRSLDDLRSGARVEVDKRKKNPLDFALWKAAKPGEPAWDSPWGKGRPGWHIECSAMSQKYLGATFDIHGGGYDLVFPHHENELAQSEASTNCQFVRYWLHNGFITINQEKMSKSTGNFFLVREILSKYPGEVVRFFLLSTHYRSPLDFDLSKLAENQKALERIKNTVRNLSEVKKQGPGQDSALEQDVKEFQQKIADFRVQLEAAMEDDFNTALAIGILFDLCREINSGIAAFSKSKYFAEALAEAWELLTVFAQDILGILRVDELTGTSAADSEFVNGLMTIILDLRQEARNKKDWNTADLIRNRLQALGVTIEDTPQGVRWRR